MNKAAFLNIVRQVAPIQDQEVEDLERLVVSFPYCQTAHVLLAKAAHDRGSMLSTQKLRKAAAHVSNRQLLKRLVYAPPAEFQLTEVTELEMAESAAAPDFEQFSEKEAENVLFISREAEEITQDTSELLVEESHSDFPEEEIDIDEVSSTENTFSVEEPETEEEISFPEPEEESFTSGTELAEETTHAPEFATSFPPVSEADDVSVSIEELLQVDFTSPASLEAQPLVASEAMEEETFLPDASVNVQTDEVLELTSVLEDVENESALLSEETAVSSEVIAQDTTTEEELLDLIHIDSLTTLTAPYPSVSLTHEEILSDIVSTSETALYNQEGKVSLEEVIAMAAADRELEDLPSLQEEVALEELEEVTIPEDQLFPWEMPGYQIPTLQQDLYTPSELVHSTSTDAYTNILTQNSLAYWMDSSRMGESLQIRDELTPSTPYYFHPELLMEHIKGHGTPAPEPVIPTQTRLDQQLNIIDQFLKTSPRLKAMANAQWKDEPIEDLSAKSSKIKKNLASENLAHIYIKQGKGRKAIKIYEQLIVKYPEKKGYFAEQIENLRNEI